MNKRAAYIFALSSLIWGAVSHAQEQGDIEAMSSMDAMVSSFAQPVERTVAVLRALDKITARITEIEAPVGDVVLFGTLEVTVRYCRTRPPEEPPETYAYLEITDKGRRDVPAQVFTGWMLASSPSLHALEHPVYDVWVISCKTRVGEQSSPRE